MINWETIKSLYNDKPTLLEWLKKVEAALSGATLTAVSVNTISVGVITLTFEFDDGTSITTPNINLPQGAQGVSITGAAIVAGKLILTLSNGTTIDAGNTGAVLNFAIDSNQHLIVNYQDGTSQDLGAIFTGNVSISGNLAVTGNITNTLLNNTEKALNGSAEVNGLYPNEDDIPLGGLPTGINVGYAHWRVSNNKLSIVLSFYVKGGEDVPTGITAYASSTFAIPQWVFDKLVGFEGEGTTALDNKEIMLTSIFDPSGNTAVKMFVRVVKYGTSSVQIQLTIPSINAWSGGNRQGRAEINFLL